jgi:3'(2'), 5'-bisphosphate nucleotidase
MTGPDLDRTLRNLALEAGAAIMAVYDAGPVAAAAKADLSPVTEADLAADRIIVEGLRAAFPAIPVVTEERPETHGANAGAHFLVDPLDGTKEFVQRRGEFTVNIALIENGVPVAGVVHAPALGRLWRTVAGGGAVVEDADGLRPLAVAQADPAALRVVASKSHRDPETDAWIARLRVAEVKSAGSSLKFCLIAAGEADVYPRLGPTMEWDTAAGQAVLEAAGGRVQRLPGLEPLRYGAAGRRNPHFVACGAGVPLDHV